MIKQVLIISFISLVFYCFTQSNNISFVKRNLYHVILAIKDSVTFKTYKTIQGWGYDIFIKNKLYVHQPNIPAVSKNCGFSKKEFAARTAILVIEKIKRHVLLPSISTFELDSLKVIK